MPAQDTSVSVEVSKYTFVVSGLNGNVSCLRHGEPWIPEMRLGAKALIMLIGELEAARDALRKAREAIKMLDSAQHNFSADVAADALSAIEAALPKEPRHG